MKNQRSINRTYFRVHMDSTGETNANGRKKRAPMQSFTNFQEAQALYSQQRTKDARVEKITESTTWEQVLPITGNGDVPLEPEAYEDIYARERGGRLPQELLRRVR